MGASLLRNTLSVLFAAGILSFTAVGIAMPPSVSSSQTRVVFAIDKTDVPAQDGDDLYMLRNTKTHTLIFRTDWRLKRRQLIWSQSADAPSITGMIARGGKVAFSRWDMHTQPNSNGTLNRLDTSVVLVDRNGANARVIASASLLTRPIDDDGNHPDPAECGEHVSVETLTESGTLFIERTTGVRTGKVCNGIENANEYRIEQLRDDGSFATHFEKRESVDIDDDMAFSDISHGGPLTMTTSRGFAVIDDGDGVVHEQLGSPGSRTIVQSPLHRRQGFSSAVMLENGSVLMKDERSDKLGSSSRVRFYLYATPHAKPKRIAPRINEAEVSGCGNRIVVWQDHEWNIARNRVLVYTDTGRYLRIVRLPIDTWSVGCAGNRLLTLQRVGKRRIALTSMTLR